MKVSLEQRETDRVEESWGPEVSRREKAAVVERAATGFPPVVLVADDDKVVLSLLMHLLQKEGCVVFAFADAKEALQFSRKYVGMIDLVVTDQVMPGLTGTELCGFLRQERPRTKVLLLSGQDSYPGDRRRSPRNPAVPFLPKPFDTGTFRSLVRHMLGIAIPQSAGSPGEVH